MLLQLPAEGAVEDGREEGVAFSGGFGLKLLGVLYLGLQRVHLPFSVSQSPSAARSRALSRMLCCCGTFKLEAVS